jgi:hypothetical protein
METIQQAQTGLAEADKQWFVAALRSELAALGNLPHFEALLKIEQSDQGMVILGSQIQGHVLGPGASMVTSPGSRPSSVRTIREHHPLANMQQGVH